MRSIYRKALRELAIWAMRKNRSTLVIIYGWDWTEGTREVLYHIIRRTGDVRRNTRWIDWDLGLPLFVLGLDYNRHQVSIKNLLMAVFSLLNPFRSRTETEYLLASLSAKHMDTLDYWLSIEPKLFILLPLREEHLSQLPYIMEKTEIVDLRAIASQPPSTKTKAEVEQSGFKFNLIQLKLVELANAILELGVIKTRLKDKYETVFDSVAKIDWQEYLINRIKRNLHELL